MPPAWSGGAGRGGGGMRRRLVLLASVLVLVATAACGAPSHSRAALHVSETDLLPTDPNMSVTDLAEAGGPDAPNVQCRYLPALTGPDTAPSTKMIVPVLAVPSDVTPEEGLDR